MAATCLLVALFADRINATPEARRRYRMGSVTQRDIVQLIYRPMGRGGIRKTMNSAARRSSNTG